MRTETPRPFGWWVAIFEQEALNGEKIRFGTREELFIDPCRGFMGWEISYDMSELHITKGCGDGRYWRDKAYEMFRFAKERYGVKYLVAHTQRNPKAYMRLMGELEIYKVTTGRDGRPKYWMRTEKTAYERVKHNGK